jgi:hypothetical protein
MVVMDETCAPIDEDGPSHIRLFELLLPKCSRETTGQAGHILIEVYDVAWIHGSVIQITFAFVKDLIVGADVRPVLLKQHAAHLGFGQEDAFACFGAITRGKDSSRGVASKVWTRPKWQCAHFW